MRDFFKGIGDFFSGFSALFTTRGLWSCVWAPFLINVVLFAAIVGSGVYFFSDLLAFLLGEEGGWLKTALWALLWFAFAAVFSLAVFFTFFATANLIASPFNDVLSARYEELVRGDGKEHDGVGKGLGIAVSLFHEIKRLILYILLFILLLIATFFMTLVPFLNLIIPLIWIVFAGLMLAFEFLSFPFDRRGMAFSEKLAFLRENLMRTGGFGIAAYLSLFVPFLNLIVIPSAVVGGTKFSLEVLGEAKRAGGVR